jgi:hypothetical protein
VSEPAVRASALGAELAERRLLGGSEIVSLLGGSVFGSVKEPAVRASAIPIELAERLLLVGSGGRHDVEMCLVVAENT